MSRLNFYIVFVKPYSLQITGERPNSSLVGFVNFIYSAKWYLRQLLIALARDAKIRSSKFVFRSIPMAEFFKVGFAVWRKKVRDDKIYVMAARFKKRGRPRDIRGDQSLLFSWGVGGGGDNYCNLTCPVKGFAVIGLRNPVLWLLSCPIVARAWGGRYGNPRHEWPLLLKVRTKATGSLCGRPVSMSSNGLKMSYSWYDDDNYESVGIILVSTSTSTKCIQLNN